MTVYRIWGELHFKATYGQQLAPKLCRYKIHTELLQLFRPSKNYQKKLTFWAFEPDLPHIVILLIVHIITVFTN